MLSDKNRQDLLMHVLDSDVQGVCFESESRVVIYYKDGSKGVLLLGADGWHWANSISSCPGDVAARDQL